MLKKQLIMSGFINQCIAYVLAKETEISSCVFILPSKRAGNFLKKELAEEIPDTLYAPEVWSIEEFLHEITAMQELSSTQALFKLYEAYCSVVKKEAEAFDVFITWGQTLLHDFNEIDRYLINPEEFFTYLSNIQDINHWALTSNKTTLVKKYLEFWKQLPAIYNVFTTNLLKEKLAYQGLMYRQAAAKCAHFFKENKEKRFYVIGFNALNDAEQQLFQTLLASEQGDVLWDIDKAFLEDPYHDAGLFIRKYKNTWAYYQQYPDRFKFIDSSYKNTKNIKIYEVSKNVGQAKQVGEILTKFDAEQLANTAVVMNDESLLTSMLNALPENITEVNITMGLPLVETPIAALIEILFDIQQEKKDTYYYKNILAFLHHPIIQRKLSSAGDKLIKEIQEENLVFIELSTVLEFFEPDEHPFLNFCLGKNISSPKQFIQHLTEALLALKASLSDAPVLKEYVFQFYQLFNQLLVLTEQYPYLDTIPLVRLMYKEQLQSLSVDFKGSPFKNLQLMGMLETRVLDYENVILTSVNEGILPSGKSQNSFIPYDLKKAYGLPTYREKDAIYTYHFYRLLQRAKSVSLLFNNDASGMQSSEKSRFITQLELERNIEIITNPVYVPPIKTDLKQFPKTPEVIKRIEALGAYGFSPSALTTYIRNPIDFYQKYILGIREENTVEEHLAANTFGTIVHESLEQLYTPFLNKKLTERDLLWIKENIANEVDKQYQLVYKKAPVQEGINLISKSISKRYLSNLVIQELQVLNQTETDTVKLIALEAPLEANITASFLANPIKLKGTADRIDVYNTTLRIIDYKTGKVLPSDLVVKDWGLLITDYKYSKAFQVLCYAYMYLKTTQVEAGVTAGVISFKNLKSGYMAFENKEGKEAEALITPAILAKFEQALVTLLQEIVNPELPFIEKEV